MFDLEDLITDRTQSDVDNKTAKGFYNVSDLQRINSYTEYLAEQLDVSIDIPLFELGSDITFDKLNTVIDNIRKIRKVWYVADDTPQLPIVAGWDYDAANAIEKNLQAMSEFWQSHIIDKLYSGTFRAGNHIKFRGNNL